MCYCGRTSGWLMREMRREPLWMCYLGGLSRWSVGKILHRALPLHRGTVHMPYIPAFLPHCTNLGTSPAAGSSLPAPQGAAPLRPHGARHAAGLSRWGRHAGRAARGPPGAVVLGCPLAAGRRGGADYNPQRRPRRGLRGSGRPGRRRGYRGRRRGAEPSRAQPRRGGCASPCPPPSLAVSPCPMRSAACGRREPWGMA